MTPLIVLVGFLGAGKTTYLRKVLPLLQARGLDPHVIINDYQNASIDAALLQDLTNSVQPISGSCVCCGSRDELLGALEAFEHVPRRVLVVETNGTTDAEELIEMLSLEPSLKDFTLPIQISIIDGRRWQKRLWHNALELEQARTANHLFISRQEALDAARKAQVEKSLAKHHIEAAQKSVEELAAEIATVESSMRGQPARSHYIHDVPCGCGHDHGHDEGHTHEHAHHEHSPAHHFASLQIELPEIVGTRALEEFLRGLPPEVIRAKGIVRLAEHPDEYHVLQKTDNGHVQLLPIGKTSRITQPVAVLIGPQIPEEQVRIALARLFPQAATT